MKHGNYDVTKLVCDQWAFAAKAACSGQLAFNIYDYSIQIEEIRRVQVGM